MRAGERIRQRRVELGLTQEELAIAAGYKSRSSINKIENSREVTLKKIKKIANILDVTPESLLGWEEKSNHKEQENNINAVTELVDYLHPLLTEEQNTKVRELINQIIYQN